MIESIQAMNIVDHIRQVPDFPKPGILFYDISTLLAHPQAWSQTIDLLEEKVSPYQPDLLAGIESRGFLTTAPLALKLQRGFMMVRKAGKLPGDVISYEYDLEYGTDVIQIQKDAITPGQKVVVMDDLLATGGTLAASIALLRKAGAEVCAAGCILELTFLKGREKLDVPFFSLVQYDA